MNASADPTDPIAWGFVGTGGISRSIADDFTSETQSIRHSVCSRDATRAEEFARAHGFERSFGILQEMLAQPDIEAIYVATPPATHLQIALAAIDAGKHVLIEKPMAMNMNEVELIRGAAAAHRRFAMEAMWMKFGNPYRTLWSEIAAGAIGEVRSVSATYGLPFPKSAGSKFSAELGGSTLLDLGIYGVTLATQLMGLPSHIDARGVVQRDGVDLSEHVTLDFEGGRFAHLANSILEFVEPRATINGSEGWISLPTPFWDAPRVEIYRGRTLEEQRNPRVLEMRSDGAGYRPMIRAVNGAIRSGESECRINSWDDTLAVFGVMDRIRDLLTLGSGRPDGR